MEGHDVNSAADVTIEEADDGGLSLAEAREMLTTGGQAEAEEAAKGNGDGAGDATPEGERPSGLPDDEDAARMQDGERTFAEGAVGLGVDIVEVERMATILKRSPSFASRVFSQAEQDYCNGKANPATHYALRFAAKEAVVKALGTGFAHGIGVRDIEVERAASGRPYARLSGRALEVAEEQGVRELSISLSYTHTDAVACAMAVTNASVRESEKRKDPAAELARLFKETRGILDDF